MYRFIERKYCFSPYRDDNFCLKVSFRTGQVSYGVSVKNETNRFFSVESAILNRESPIREKGVWFKIHHETGHFGYYFENISSYQCLDELR